MNEKIAKITKGEELENEFYKKKIAELLCNIDETRFLRQICTIIICHK